MKRILQIAATSFALLMVFAVAVPALAASTCPTATTAVSPVSTCLTNYKLTSGDISNIQEALKACGLSAKALQYGPVCQSGDCTTPDCTKVDCDGTACITTDCAGTVCNNTGSTPVNDNSCTEADCATNGCDAADCKEAGCKDNCAQTKCIPAVEEEPAAEATDDTAVEAVASTKAKETKNTSEVKAAATEQAQEDATEATTEDTAEATTETAVNNCPTDFNDAIAKAKEAIKGYTGSSSCPTGSGNEVAGVSAPKSSGSNCPTSNSGSDTRAQLQDAVSKALEQAKSKVSASVNCPTGSGSVDVNSVLNQLQNSGLYNCNK